MYTPAPPGVPPSWGGPNPFGTAPPALPPFHPSNDLAALSRFRVAAVVAILGVAASTVLSSVLSSGGYLGFPGGSSSFRPFTGGTFPTFTTMFLVLVIASVLVGIAFLLVSLWFFRTGFVELRSVDPRFARSPTWTLLSMIGLVIVAPGVVVVLLTVSKIASCAGTTVPVPPACLDLGTLLGGGALFLVGGILAIVGFIGTLVAIWRLGDRYGESLFKVGAVLLIFPLVSLVGQILIFVAARGATSRLNQPRGPVFAPSIPSAPPPPG